MRAPNMQTLTDNINSVHSGVVIYGIGDEAHKQRSSDHNEDDTPGVRTPQTDADGIPEHRAIDAMIGPKFTKADADKLVADVLSNPADLARLTLIIWNGHEWSRSNDWKKEVRTEDPHTDHVHFSGLASADDNTAPFFVKSAPKPPSPAKTLVVDGDLGPKTISKWQSVMGTHVDGRIDEHGSDLIEAVQRRLKSTVDHTLVIDGDPGPKTIAALQRYLKTPVTRNLDTNTVKALQRRLNENRF
jgi:hypothetical protein